MKKELTEDERLAYEIAIHLNNVYFRGVNAMLKCERDSSEWKNCVLDVKKALDEIPNAYITISSVADCIEDDFRRDIFHQLAEYINGRFKEDVENVENKENEELMMPDYTIEEFLGEFETALWIKN